MKKYYFETKYSEICYPKEYFIEKMKDENIDEMEVFEAEKEKIDGTFWCKLYSEFGEKGNGFYECGKSCKGYEPKNGKSGCCNHYTRTLFSLEKKVKLKL